MSTPLPPGFSYALLHDDDGEIAYEYALQAEAVAELCDLGVLSHKTLTTGVVDCNGELVAAAWTAIADDEYSVDIAVVPKHQGKGLGAWLLDNHLEIPYELQEAYPDAKVVMDVVNPLVAHMLAKRGFAIDEVYQGHWLMRQQKDVLSPHPLPELSSDELGVKQLTWPEAQRLLQSFGHVEAVQLEDGRLARVAVTLDKPLLGSLALGAAAEHGVTIQAMAVEQGRLVQWYDPKLIRWAPTLSHAEEYALLRILQEKGVQPNTPEANAARLRDAQAFAENLLENLFADDTVRHTRILSEILSRCDTIHYQNTDLGTGSFSVPETVIRAASSQSFTPELTEEGGLALVFDGARYELTFPSNASQDDLALFQRVLKQELFDNYVIERTQRMKMGLSHYSPRPWLTTPLSTGALGAALTYTEYCQRDEFMFGRTETVKMDPVRVMALAQKHLFNLDYSASMRKMVMLFQDEQETIIQVQLNPSLPEIQAQELFSALRAESEQNFGFVRQNDPEIAKIKANMAAANTLFAEHVDPELESYMAAFREDQQEAAPATAEIVPFGRRR